MVMILLAEVILIIPGALVILLPPYCGRAERDGAPAASRRPGPSTNQTPNYGGRKIVNRRAAHAHQIFYCQFQIAQRDCRSRLAVVRWDGGPGARSAGDPKQFWAIGSAAAARATSPPHRASAAAPQQALHEVVRRAVLRRPKVSPGAISGRMPVAICFSGFKPSSPGAGPPPRRGFIMCDADGRRSPASIG
jgi:hypothetical protein